MIAFVIYPVIVYTSNDLEHDTKYAKLSLKHQRDQATGHDTSTRTDTLAAIGFV